LWKWYVTKSNLYGQCNPHQNSNDILHRDRKINMKVHIEAQSQSLNNQSNSEQKEQCWKYDDNTWIWTVLQSHNNKNSIILTKKQTWRPDKNPHSYSHLILDKGDQIMQWRKKQLHQQMVLRKRDQPGIQSLTLY
jgi:hypothetical protein